MTHTTNEIPDYWISHLRDDDTVRMPGETDTRHVISAGWDTRTQSHVLHFSDGYVIHFPTENAPKITLVHRPSAGDLHRRYQVGERVVVHTLRGETPGVITFAQFLGEGEYINNTIQPFPWNYCYDVATPFGTQVAGSDRLRPDPEPIPAIGQTWTTVKPDSKGRTFTGKLVTIDTGQYSCGLVGTLRGDDGRELYNVLLGGGFWTCTDNPAPAGPAPDDAALVFASWAEVLENLGGH